jgi:membrane protease YdiL (CAAX protease family)
MTLRRSAAGPFLLSLGMSLAGTWLSRRGRARRVRRGVATAGVLEDGPVATGVLAGGPVATAVVSARTIVPGIGPSTGLYGLGMAAAGGAFAATFRGPRDRFWDRMTLTGLGLGTYALLASGPARRTRIGRRDVALGLGSAGVLYLTFKAGDAFARRFVPSGDAEIREIYALRTLRPRPEIALRLATVIGPAEELFWRGLVQEALMRRFGRWPGAALAAASYGGVHVVTGNFTLFGAAGIAGAHWCALYAAGVPLGALVVSHVAWDVWIFLVQPTGETEPAAA